MTQALKSIVVDDEPLARSRLKRQLEQLNVTVVAEGETGLDALELLSIHPVDIIFLDISMPRMTGLEAAEQIAKNHTRPPSIVFCTAFDEHAIDAFKSNASAYLLKPVSTSDLQDVLQRAGTVNQLQLTRLQQKQPTLVEPQVDDASSRLVISTQGNIENIELGKIAYFRSVDKHVFAYIYGRGETLVDYTLTQLQDSYPQALIRTHRSTLAVRANLQKLQRTAPGQVAIFLKGVDQPLPVSRRHVKQVKQCF